MFLQTFYVASDPITASKECVLQSIWKLVHPLILKGIEIIVLVFPRNSVVLNALYGESSNFKTVEKRATLLNVGCKSFVDNKCLCAINAIGPKKQVLLRLIDRMAVVKFS